MLKKLSIFAVTGLVAWNCSLVKEDRINCNFTVPVNVRLTGFTCIQEDFPDTKATTDPAEYSAVNAVTLAFYQGNTEVYKSTQLKNEAPAFGTFSLSLPMGTYTMVAITHTSKQDYPFTLTSPTAAAYTGDHAYETFTYTQSVNITDTEAVNISATLSRVISQLKVVSTDGKTANVSNVRMTFSAGGRAFNPTTGYATVNTGFSNTVGNTAAVGTTSTSSTVFFLASDEQTMDVTIETLDVDGNTLFSKTVQNVPFKRNRITKLSGAMYTNSSTGGSFQLTTDWETEYSGSF